MYVHVLLLYLRVEYLRACLYYFFGQLGFKSLIQLGPRLSTYDGYLQPLPAGMYQDIIITTTTTTTTDWTICSGHHRHSGKTAKPYVYR